MEQILVNGTSVLLAVAFLVVAISAVLNFARRKIYICERKRLVQQQDSKYAGSTTYVPLENKINQQQSLNLGQKIQCLFRNLN